MILRGDCREVLAGMAEKSVQCVVTSPPYYGLRDYGTATWDGGDPACDHKKDAVVNRKREFRELGETHGYNPSSNFANYGERYGRAAMDFSNVCGKCGARRVDQQIGLEATPAEYIATMVEVFRAVRRVLRDDGTVWCNLGDSYANDTKWGGSTGGKHAAGNHGQTGIGRQKSTTGLKSKDLCMIPARVALALQAPYEKPHNIKSETDRAWLAALIDGEGCIGIRRYDSHSNKLDAPRCQDGFVPYVSIGNNDRELLDRCVQLTGYGKVGVKDRPNVDSRGIVSRRTYFGWRLDGNKAMDVIQDVYPFLIAKRRQAVVCNTLDLSNKNGRALRGNGQLPAGEQEKREELKRLVNACNQREAVDIPSWCEEPKRIIEPGWYLRSDIIWAKGLSFCDSYSGSVMPESATDRPTSAYEHVFLLTKSARYYYDADAVREESSWGRENNPEWQHARVDRNEQKGAGNRNGKSAGFTKWDASSGRNLRNVWAINPSAFADAHFATFPMALVEPCVKAGTSQKGQCVACGTPWRRVVEKGELAGEAVIQTTDRPAAGVRGVSQTSALRTNGRTYRESQTTGWAAQCECNAAVEPQTVLDIFAGSGTTLIVAKRLGRNAIGIELSEEYADMADAGVDGPLFAGGQA